jgi:hypothetical protein
MSDTEDYPGPTQNQPEKDGQNPLGKADENMVKPPAKPEGPAEKQKPGSADQKKSSR